MKKRKKGDKGFIEHSEGENGIVEVRVTEVNSDRNTAQIEFILSGKTLVLKSVPFTHIYSSQQECRSASSRFWRAFTQAVKNGTSLQSELSQITHSRPIFEAQDYEDVYRVEEVAKKFKVGDRVIRQWIGEGKLVAKKIGREYFVTKAAIKEFLNFEDEQARLEANLRFMADPDFSKYEKINPSAIDAIRVETREIMESRNSHQRCAMCNKGISESLIHTSFGAMCKSCFIKLFSKNDTR